ncbi:exopolyphosphatase, partial [Staphylococcus haemolyticus]
IILPAVSVFKTLFKKIDATQFTFSRNGIREGFAMNLIRKRHPHEFKKEHVRRDALKHLANEYHIEEESAKRRLKLAQSLLDQLLKHSD